MRIEAFNVPVLGSSKKIGTSTLSYNINDIVSLILNDTSTLNPYKAAYNYGYNRGMDSETLLNLVDTCYKLSTDKNTNEGFCAIIGSLLAGYLMSCWSDVKKFGETKYDYGMLLPFIGVYTAIVSKKYPNDDSALNTYQICDMFKKACENSFPPMSEDSFDLSIEQIQESKIMPKILKRVLNIIHKQENIPTDERYSDNDRECIEETEEMIRDYLLKDFDNDPQYIEGQICYIRSTLLDYVFSNITSTVEINIILENVKECIHREVSNAKFDNQMKVFEKYVNINMAYATQGYIINLIFDAGIKYGYPTKPDALKDALIPSYQVFMDEIVKYFKMDWYPEFISTCKESSIKNRSVDSIFGGIYKIFIQTLISIFIHFNMKNDDSPRGLWITAFNNDLSIAWNHYMNEKEDLDLTPCKNSDEYFKYIMSFTDAPMDIIENEHLEGDDGESISDLCLHSNIGTPTPNKFDKNSTTGNYQTTIIGSVTEAKNASIRYQEKQGSRIGTNVGKAFKTASENVGEIWKQFKKISVAVYKWITTDKNNDKLVLDGRKFTFPGLIKRILLSVGLFHVNIIAGVVAWIFLWSKQKKANKASRKKMIMMLEEEIQMTEEKIQDATSDGNRKAKYALMRSKNQLQNALNKLKFGMGVDLKDEEQPAVREVRDRALSGGKIAPNDSLRTARSTDK